MFGKKKIFTQLEKLSVQIEALHRKIELYERDLTHDLCRIEEELSRSQDAYTKMADRLVQMAMVQRGDTRGAVAHRTQERAEKQVPEVEVFQPEDEWPPKGTDAMMAP